jgi:maleate cis-trans isomerase
MFEESLPVHKIGVLAPLGVLDNGPFEFYRLWPKGCMQVVIPVGLAEFSSKDVERVFAPLDTYLDQLMERGVEIVIQNGVPLPILIGVEAHDKMVAHMGERTGLPATSTVTAVCKTAKQIGLRKLAVANKWSDKMNACLAEFLARDGVEVVGVAKEVIAPKDFMKIDDATSMELAWKLGQQAFRDFPDCDGLYVGGGSWLAEPVCNKLEREFGKPVICNETARIRHVLHLLNDWKPIEGHGRVLSHP